MHLVGGGKMSFDPSGKDPECTCDEDDIEPHTCPFNEEINGDEDECNCCEFCEGNCRDNI